MRRSLKYAWNLSQNYFYGTAVKQDRVKALAWQYVYVTSLPDTYPGGYQLLNKFKASLTKEEISDAYQQAQLFKKKYQLPGKLTEAGLSEVFNAKEDVTSNVTEQRDAFQTVKDFFAKVAAKDPVLAKRYQNKYRALLEQGEGTIIYGQLTINGGIDRQWIHANQPISVDKYGFFMQVATSPLLLFYPGYQRVVKEFSTSGKVSSLGQVVLNSLPETMLSSVVGRIILPNKGQDFWAVLKAKEQYLNGDEPWLTPTIPLTFLPNGQFYAKGLSPVTYQLMIANQGKVVEKEFSLHPGQVKTLSAIYIK